MNTITFQIRTPAILLLVAAFIAFLMIDQRRKKSATPQPVPRPPVTQPPVSRPPMAEPVRTPPVKPQPSPIPRPNVQHYSTEEEILGRIRDAGLDVLARYAQPVAVAE